MDRRAAEGLDERAVVAAYARWAPIYDPIFGLITRRAIRATMARLNALPPGRVLEVGVGTGIALPLYKPGHRVTGIDLSPDMLKLAERRVREKGLTNVDAIREMDAANLAFADGSFDVAVAMFVMSVVPDPGRVLDEMQRVVKSGGRIVTVNHFKAERGARARLERWLARYGAKLGWHPEFAIETVLGHPGLRLIEQRELPPLGLYTLLVFERS
jgi:phosphatidylethanolamine/phosphatidyl-N-methylethanolamine N-methyltransferase